MQRVPSSHSALFRASEAEDTPVLKLTQYAEAQRQRSPQLHTPCSKRCRLAASSHSSGRARSRLAAQNAAWQSRHMRMFTPTRSVDLPSAERRTCPEQALVELNYESIAELMCTPEAYRLKLLYTPIRCRLYVSLFKPFIEAPGPLNRLRAGFVWW